MGDEQVEALTIQVPVGDTTPYYWKAAAYDTFDGQTWLVLRQQRKGRQPGRLVDPRGHRRSGAVAHSSGTPSRSRSRRSTSPGGPSSRRTPSSRIDLSTSLTVVGPDGYFGGLEANDSFNSYTATALVPRVANDGFTANKLRAASADYPAEIRATYLRPIAPRHPRARISLKLIDEIKPGPWPTAWPGAPGRRTPAAFCATNAYDPYDLAEAAKAVLRSDEFHYKTDITGLECENMSTVECFAEFKQGYCQQYATTMAMVLRSLGVATRYVQGWLPSLPTRRASRRSC